MLHRYFLQATRGSIASKSGIAKVPKQVAVAFMKRTLARCRKFEDTGKSCFSEPALQEIIYGVPRDKDAELTSMATANLPTESQNPKLEPILSGFPSFQETFYAFEKWIIVISIFGFQ